MIKSNRFWHGYLRVPDPYPCLTPCYIAGKTLKSYMQQLEFLNCSDSKMKEDDFSGDREILDLYSEKLNNSEWGLEDIITSLDSILKYGYIDLIEVRDMANKQLQALRSSES